MHKLAVLDVVGLTPSMLGPHMPRLSAWASRGQVAPIQAIGPAVTCSAQATYLTGTPPTVHGVVGNGWYFRDEGEVKFWRQSNRLVQAPKLWEVARVRDPAFTCANLFWWFNMVTTADIAVTPRPMYLADGRKLPDIATRPADLRSALQGELGQFPLFDFWGPRASIRSSQWIAEAARRVGGRHAPTLSLVYLPHLDYALQKLGPNHPGVAAELRAIDQVAGGLIDFYEAQGARVVVLSEYGLTEVRHAVPINQALRMNGLLAVREERGREHLDPAESAAFAVADHQVAHVYVNDPAKLGLVRRHLEGLDGVEQVLDARAQRQAGMAHARSGELVAIARPDAWFSYYYWLDDRRAPDYARTVDIHRKPGYDPVELFLDPALPWPAGAVGWRLLKKALGFRTLMDVVPLDPGLVRGSHGRPGPAGDAGPLLITRHPHMLTGPALAATDVFEVLLRHLELSEERWAA